MLLSFVGCGEVDPTVVGTVPEDKTISISIAVCGDVMAHMPQLEAAKKADGTYDFNRSFDYVRGIMSGVDLCMANVECTFPGSGEYAGYPGFKTPDSMAEALANAGVDVGLFANNHMNDSGLAGALRTAEVIRDYGMQTVGCRTSESDPRSIIVPIEKDGEVVKVGVVAYAYETSQGDTNRTMNGGAMKVDAPNYYNTFRQYADLSVLDKDIEGIKNEIAWCKENSDIVLVYLHWGEEYQRHSNARQQYIAERLAEAAPDAIIASHPHVLQEIAEVNGVPVYYSIGNYVSNQREETLDNHYTEQGLIAMLNFDLTKSAVDDGKYVIDGFGEGAPIYGTPEEVALEAEYNKKIFKFFSKAPEKSEVVWDSWSAWSKEGETAKAVPTWVNRYKEEGKTVYEIVPLINGFEENAGLNFASYVGRAGNALKEITELLGEEYIWNLK